jgi:hypothetical protein
MRARGKVKGEGPTGLVTLTLAPHPSPCLSPLPLSAPPAYLLVALAFTWPLVTGLSRDIPWIRRLLLNC